MSFKNLTQAAQIHFPNLKIVYDNRNTLVKFIENIFNFNSYTIYLPPINYIKIHPISQSVSFMHDLMHVYDSNRLNKLIFNFLYLFPQLLSVLCLPLLFFFSWKLILPAIIILLAPIPSYFRAHLEMRAYISSLYVLNILGRRLRFNPHILDQKNIFVEQFSNVNYYFMFPFKKKINKKFEEAMGKIMSGGRPFEDPIFDILDDLISKV